MNESSWHHCVDCDTELGPAPGADGSGPQWGVTFCPGCGAMYRWDFWRLNRYRGDTGSIYEPRLERHGSAAHTRPSGAASSIEAYSNDKER